MRSRRPVRSKRTRRAARLVGSAVCLAALLPLACAPPAPQVPETRRGVVVENFHGVELSDPYRWLEDQQAQETRAWIDAQNAYTDQIIGPLPHREAIQTRLTEMYRIDTISPPFYRGGRYFLSKRAADQDLNVLYMRRSLDGPDEILIDPHGMSADNTVSVGFRDASRDGTLLAYHVRQGGEDEVEVHFRDVDTGEELEDVMPKSRYFGISITPGRGGVYYSKHTAEGPRVYYHSFGSDFVDDQKLFGDGYGPDKIIGAGLSDDRRYLVIRVSHGSAASKTEIYVQDLAEGGPIFPIVNDVEAAFNGSIAGDSMFLRTNWDAPNYRVFAVDLRRPSRDRWREIIPEGESVLTGISAVGGKLFARYLENVQPRVRIFEPDGTAAGEIDFPTIGSGGFIAGDWNRDEAFYTFSSIAQPTTIYRYDVASGEREVWARLDVPVDGDSFEVKQVWFTSKDGTEVPMFIAHRRGLEHDGNNPTLLTGYGGFNISRLANFSQRAAFWMESGGVYALPNLRGGGEFGEEWHSAGMLENKQNVFDDFIAAAEWLIDNGYTSPSKLAISGGSNGGLLVGAAMTQRPELYQAVVCTYPLLDMLRYHNFLVARYWVPEYGSSEDPVQFEYIAMYSPYQNVDDGEQYPAVLFITGDADTRVDPLHARKMTALMQASSGSDNPVILRYNTKAGHSGGRPISTIIEDMSDEMRFLFWQLGVDYASE